MNLRVVPQLEMGHAHVAEFVGLGEAAMKRCQLVPQTERDVVGTWLGPYLVSNGRVVAADTIYKASNEVRSDEWSSWF